jgi:putative transposase
MSNKYKFRNPEGVYFVTSTVYNRIDIFTRNEYRDIVVDSLRYCMDNKGLEIYGWCLMTNHLHLLATGFDKPMEQIMRDFKRHTSVELREADYAGKKGLLHVK